AGSTSFRKSLKNSATCEPGVVLLELSLYPCPIGTIGLIESECPLVAKPLYVVFQFVSTSFKICDGLPAMEIVFQNICGITTSAYFPKPSNGYFGCSDVYASVSGPSGLVE